MGLMAEEKAPDNPWEQPIGDYIENADGSLDRIMPVPGWVKEMAAREGLTLIPDHIPADEVERWFRIGR
jgi:hypothetical protein